MSRLPNPWIAVPALVGGLIAGWLGWTITAVSCRYQDVDGTVVTCPGWSLTVSLLAFLLVTAGIAVVMVLVYRSLAEWRDQEQQTRS